MKFGLFFDVTWHKGCYLTKKNIQTFRLERLHCNLKTKCMRYVAVCCISAMQGFHLNDFFPVQVISMEIINGSHG